MLLTIFNRLFSITHHTVPTKPRDSCLVLMAEIKSYYMLHKHISLCETLTVEWSGYKIFSLSKNHNWMLKHNSLLFLYHNVFMQWDMSEDKSVSVAMLKCTAMSLVN